MESFLIKQIESLTEQNKLLMEENKMLNLKIISLLENSSKEENIVIKENPNDNIPNYEDWINTFDKYLTFNDIKYDSGDFVQSSIHCLMKVFAKNNCIKTINKKRKIMSIKRKNNWEEISFIEFIEITKKITDNCMKVLHRLMLDYKKKNVFDTAYEDRHSHILVCMYDDLNKYKETLANKLVDLLV